MVTRAQIARRLWNDYLKVEYYKLSELAAVEWNPETASHTPPCYSADGERIFDLQSLSYYEDPLYNSWRARYDHYAVRTYILKTETMGSQLMDGKFPDKDVFGEITSTGRLPEGIPLVGRIMGALGYKRGCNNLGQTYFALNSEDADWRKKMHADAVHLDPPDDAPELPKQFISQLHVNDLRKTHPLLATYITELMLKAPDPLEELKDILEKLHCTGELSENDTLLFLEAAAASIKERPWKIPLENALAEKWDLKRWQQEVNRLQDVLHEHNENASEASQYAVWTIFNGLRVNHEAFLTGNIYDTMLCHIIDGRTIIDPAGTEKSFVDPVTGIELGGLIQAAVAAIPRKFVFLGPKGQKFTFYGEGPFVEYIERTVRQNNEGKWIRINDAFLPGNARKIFQSTMPETRESQSWALKMRQKFEADPLALLYECQEQGWTRSEQKLVKFLSQMNEPAVWPELQLQQQRAVPAGKTAL